jgi:copper oxidase (laccase) domain-containing protein
MTLMINRDQPTIFKEAVIAKVSSLEDGNMRFGRGDDELTLRNRLQFLKHAGISPDHTTLVQVTYDTAEHFARYHIVTDNHKALGIYEPKSDLVADALATSEAEHALFLPLADCVGLVIYDERRHVLMVSHVGRHSAEIEGASKSIQYLQEHFKSDSGDIKVWLSPAVGKATYPLHSLQNKSLHEVITEQLKKSGVKNENIEVSDVDTAEDENYFSHSKFLAGQRPNDGRFAIVAMMTAQGEPAS